MAALRRLLLLVLLPGVLAARELPDEYDVKAVFLAKFGLFVRWPESAFADAGAPLVLGVVGPDPFGPRLERALAGRVLGGRTIEVRRFASGTDLGACHVLYVGYTADQDRDALRATLERARRQSTLTVGEAEGFIEAGGTLQFVLREGRVRFRVDVEHARQAGLDVSAKLLQLSE